MPPSELTHLADITQEVVYTAKDTIIRQGEHGDSMFLIAEGEVRIHLGDTDLAVLKAKDYFGEMSILDGEPRSASATAVTDCLLLRINQTDFYSILSHHTEVALTIIRTLTRRLRQMGTASPQPTATSEEESPPNDQPSS